MTTQSGSATVHIMGKHNPLAWILFFTKLSVEVDGTAEVGKWGSRNLSVSPGPHEIKVYFKYLTKARCGEAAVNVTAPEGGTVSLSYKAPKLMTSPGKIEVTS